MLYFLVFLAKLCEVSLATMRMVLVNRGEKLKGAMIGFFEVMIWAILASNVLKDLMDDPFKLIVYCLAFSCGNYLGVTLESKLAIGVAQIQVVVSVEKTHLLANVLRSKEFGVTIIPAKGMEGPVNVLMIYVKRKNVPAAIDIINEFSPQAVITINDVRHLHNAYIVK